MTGLCLPEQKCCFFLISLETQKSQLARFADYTAFVLFTAYTSLTTTRRSFDRRSTNSVSTDYYILHTVRRLSDFIRQRACSVVNLKGGVFSKQAHVLVHHLLIDKGALHGSHDHRERKNTAGP